MMVNSCCAYGCTNVYNPTLNVRFHLFPHNEPDRLAKWIHALRRKKFRPSKTTTICSEHFLESDYTGNVNTSSNRKILKKTAIPSKFDFPSHLQPKVSNRRILGRNNQVDCSVKILKNDNQIMNDSVADSVNDISVSSVVLCYKDVGTQTTIIGHEADKILEKLRSDNKKLRRIKKILQQRLKRRDLRINNIGDLIKMLRKENVSNTQLEVVLKEKFGDVAGELMKNQSVNCNVPPSQRRYSEEVKKFALTLYFYLAKSYKFVRTILILPHPSTIRKMLATRNCQVGILSEVLEFLKKKTAEKDCEYLKDVALMFDSMSIHKGMQYDKKNDKYSGFVDLGGIATLNNKDRDDLGTEQEVDDIHTEHEKESIKKKAMLDLATEALVFNIVSYTKKFKVPVAYFFVNKISGLLLKELTLMVIESLYENGVTTRSLTADGCGSNILAFKLLGCNFADINNIKSSFKHPCNPNVNVHFILDPCHMIKLVRGTFAECKLSTKSEETIRFSLIKDLHKLQQNINFKLANKLSNTHIFYANKKMKVRLATQLLSNSVADALQYLEEECKHPDFVNCAATINFIKIFDKTFDIMNARAAFQKGLKGPLTLSNMHIWSSVLKETCRYMNEELLCDGLPIFKHKRKTFALGFSLNAASFQNLCVDLLKHGDRPLKYFLPYKCSQDHLELMFCCIRSRGGWNNNPNTLQFKWALRQLLFRNSIQASDTGNCTNLENNDSEQFEFIPFQCVDELDGTEKFCEAATSIELGTLTHCVQKNILYYIAGYIARNYLKKFDCPDCRNIIVARHISEHSYNQMACDDYKKFNQFKNRGGLLFVKDVIYDIICTTEKLVNECKINDGLKGNHLKTKFVCSVVNYFIPKLSKFLPEHPIPKVRDNNLNSHVLQIIKFFCSSYCSLKIYTYANELTLDSLGNHATLRSKLHNTILFYNI